MFETLYKDSSGTVCTDWPESTGFTCTSEGDSWKQLDSSMNYSQVEACEILCKQEDNAGCCVLDQKQSNHTGCWWKSGSSSVILQSAEYKSVTCSFGMLKRSICLIQGYLKIN